MEINYNNFINTTGVITVDDATDTAAFMFYNDLRFEYGTNNFADDDTTASITISFTSTTTVDRIAMVNHNLKDFTLFYNGVTANTFAMTAASDTTVSDYTSNSETSKYIRVTPVDVTSVTLDMSKTIVADQNKKIGYYAISENRTIFGERLPNSFGYLPALDVKGVNHYLADGTVRSQILEDNWKTTIILDYVSETVRDELKSIYDDHVGVLFAPFGTTTGWDAILFPANWLGPFEFYKHSDNAAAAGFSGSIRFEETSSL